MLQEFVTELCGMNMIDVVKTDKKHYVTCCKLGRRDGLNNLTASPNSRAIPDIDLVMPITFLEDRKLVFLFSYWSRVIICKHTSSNWSSLITKDTRLSNAISATIPFILGIWHRKC